MDTFISFCKKALPSFPWLQKELKIDKCRDWFAEDYKYSVLYLGNDVLITDVHIHYFEDATKYYDKNEFGLLKLTGAKAYKLVEDVADDMIYKDIKQTAQRCGISKYDVSVTKSGRANIAFCYANILVVVSAPVGLVTKVAHKVLMNIVVSAPYKHESVDVLSLIEQFETSHLINPLGCKCCERPSRTILQNLKICSGCMQARYCDRDCQKKDWKNHKCVCLYKPLQ